MNPAMSLNPGFRLSKGAAISYICDWLIVLAIAAVGIGFSRLTPNHRPFDLRDPTISFPYVEKQKISVGVLTVVGLAGPAAIIFLISVLRVPGSVTRTGAWCKTTLRARLWEWHTGWLGLALALASTFFLTQGMKSLFGKPRPDLLSRCDPDLANVLGNTVGGYEGTVLVSWTICRQTDKSRLKDGFASFPSGHSSFSFAGLTYLTLFICSKFAIMIPYLLPYPHSTLKTAQRSQYSTSTDDAEVSSPPTPLRNQAASPPIYLLILPAIPFCTAIYISSTRYSDFRHQGFDIIFGSLLGIVLAWASFRMYHLPIRRGAGWSWGPRSASRAWGIRAGELGYVAEDKWNERGGLEEGRKSAGHSSGAAEAAEVARQAEREV